MTAVTSGDGLVFQIKNAVETSAQADNRDQFLALGRDHLALQGLYCAAILIETIAGHVHVFSPG